MYIQPSRLNDINTVSALNLLAKEQPWEVPYVFDVSLEAVDILNTLGYDSMFDTGGGFTYGHFVTGLIKTWDNSSFIHHFRVDAWQLARVRRELGVSGLAWRKALDSLRTKCVEKGVEEDLELDKLLRG
jgi:hypothetical protein